MNVLPEKGVRGKEDVYSQLEHPWLDYLGDGDDL